MVRLSNGIITTLNLLTLLIGLMALALSLLLYIKVETPCERTLRMPLLVAGGGLMVVSMVGLLGSCCRVSFFMWLYLVVLFVLIIWLTVFTIFVMIVTNKGLAESLPGEHYKKVGDYSNWLQNYMLNQENWGKFKTCLHDMKMCQKIEGGKNEDYYKYGLSPFKAGCCKPPNSCGMVFKNATTWTMPAKGPSVPNLDCKTWSNDQTQLCFNCEACKVAAMDKIRHQWRTLAIINTCVLFSVSIIYSISCCALRNNQNYGYHKHRDFYA